MSIKEFKNQFAWLSNFEPCLIIIDDIIFGSVETAYMSAKSDSKDWKNFCTTNLPGVVKRKGKKVELVENWENIKLAIMEDCLRQKFTKPRFKELLLATGGCLIEEGNTWGDTFWGVDIKTGNGENNLGKLIMKIREELK